MVFPAGVYLVADAGLVPDRNQLLEIVAQAVEGGITSLQIRDKASSEEDLGDLVTQALKITRPAGIPLLVNDSVLAAFWAGADGVHIGQGDAPYLQAREALGPDALIGLSLEAVGQWSQARTPGLSYVAASPVFSTPTKTDTAPALGLDGLRFLAEGSPIPVVAIGGIAARNLLEVVRHGAYAVAVVSAICLAPSPYLAARELAAIFEEARQPS